MPSILHIQRRPLPTQFSVEGYIERVRSAWSDGETPKLFQVPCFSRGLLPRLRNMLAVWRQSADVYHVTGDIHYVACVLPRGRTVLTILDCQILERLTGWRRALVKYFWYTLPVRHAAQITVISSETKARLLEHVNYPAERIHVIPVSVSEIYQPCPKPFNAECPRILQIGTKANKNVPRLVQALRGLRCHLDIVGPVDDQLRELLAECNIQWTVWGRLSDAELLQRYQEADIVAFVSTSEGFGMPIVEAQRVERVCVTSNCSSMPEVAGEGACFVDPRSIDSIRAGFDLVIASRDYRDGLIALGRKNSRRFDAAQIAMQFSWVYAAAASLPAVTSSNIGVAASDPAQLSNEPRV